MSNKSKLTLSIDENIVKEIKKLCFKRGVSVSSLVKIFFEKELKKSKLDINKLKGAFGKDNGAVNWKEIKTERLLKKYGLKLK